MTTPLSWPELEALTDFQIDTVNGPTNAQARLRLFGQSESDVRVTLYRDNHAWCPYCQKIWLWLEEKRIPYRIEKVTMFCYGEKERWYKRKVPSGMLPAVELDGRLITESDDILIALEKKLWSLGLEHDRSPGNAVAAARAPAISSLVQLALLSHPFGPRGSAQPRPIYKGCIPSGRGLGQHPWPLFLGGLWHC
jgi:glutaredoxin